MNQRKSFNFHLAQSQICEPDKKQNIKSNQINLLNLNFSRCSSINSNTELKSDRTPRKLSYKYERMNNSFRLVQVNPNDTDNKQNQGEKKNGQSDAINSQMHMSINSLCQRVQKLEKSQSYDNQRQQFNLHKTIQKIVEENASLHTSKYCLHLQKKIQNIVNDVNQLKERLLALPQKVIANQKLIVKECLSMQMAIEEQIQEVKMENARSAKEQAQRIWEKISYNQKVGHNEKLEEKQKQKVENMIVCMQQNLQISLQTFRKILQNHRQQLQQVREQQIKIGGSCTFMESKLNKLMAEAKSKLEDKDKIYEGNSKVECLQLQNLMGKLIIEYGFQTLKSKQKDEKSEKNKRYLVYGIDPAGQLVDGEGFYLISRDGHCITLTSEQIAKLRGLQILDNNK